MEGKSSVGKPNQSQIALPQAPALQLSQPPSKANDVGLESLKRFVKGGASGLLSGALLQPFQVVKTSMQVSVQD